MDEKEQRHRMYWRTNITFVAVLLVFWALPSLGAGILFVDQLNKIQIGGFPLGFWFAQQGSIYIFVVLILIYALAMDRIDRKFRGDEVGD